ncbi:MAG: hypothetical protein PHV10_07700 [Sulfuricurvum sp.]|nr:hypothetical protein [Sulfuricurvum sp.]
MIVRKMQDYGEFEPYSHDETTLVIGEHTLDINVLQREDQVIIDLMEGDRFIANVIIPPARFEPVESESEESTPPPMLPADMEAVVLILWAKPTKG